MTTPSLQRNVELFAEDNESLLALLGSLSFDRRLEELVCEGTRRRARQRRRADGEIVLVLLGAISVSRTIRRAVVALASSPPREPERRAEPEPVQLSLRELLR